MPIYPGIPHMYTITIKSGGLIGTIVHGLNTTPKLGRPNPNRNDGYNARAYADENIITVELDAPVSADTEFTVPAVVD